VSEHPSPLSVAGDGVRVAVRVTPRASRNGIGDIAAEADGGAVLRVSVTAVVEDGKANAAVIKLLAREWGVPKSAISVARGASNRRKTLSVMGDSGELSTRLGGWLAGRHG